MTNQFNAAIHFNGASSFTSTSYLNNYPVSTGNPKYSNGYDWVDCDVPSIGKTNTTLFCRAIPSRKIEDFYQYFSNNEIIWYKFFLLKNDKIFKILKIKSFNLSNSYILDPQKPFPTLAYVLTSEVSDVIRTNDNLYKTEIEFEIIYSYHNTP